MTTELEEGNQMSVSRDGAFNWRNYVVLAPMLLSGVLWLMSLETRLHEDGNRLVSIVQQSNALEARVRANEIAVHDPRSKPETAVTLEAVKKTLEDRNERINKLEERISAFNAIILQNFIGHLSSQSQRR